MVNDANRWAIRENMKGLKFDADGGLRIYIQTERPSEDKVSNWLPAPKSGNFNITMRNYMPSQEIVEQRYDPIGHEARVSDLTEPGQRLKAGRALLGSLRYRLEECKS